MRATRRVQLLRPFRHEAGYLCARAEWIADAPPCAEGDPHAQLAQLTEHLVLGRELRLALAGWVGCSGAAGAAAGRARPALACAPPLPSARARARPPNSNPNPDPTYPNPAPGPEALVPPLPRRASCGAC